MKLTTHRAMFVPVLTAFAITSCGGQSGSFTANQMSYNCEITFTYKIATPISDGDLFKAGMALFLSAFNGQATSFPGATSLKEAATKANGEPFPITKEALELSAGLLRLGREPIASLQVTSAAIKCPVESIPLMDG